MSVQGVKLLNFGETAHHEQHGGISMYQPYRDLLCLHSLHFFENGIDGPVSEFQDPVRFRPQGFPASVVATRNCHRCFFHFVVPTSGIHRYPKIKGNDIALWNFRACCHLISLQVMGNGSRLTVCQRAWLGLDRWNKTPPDAKPLNGIAVGWLSPQYLQVQIHGEL